MGVYKGVVEFKMGRREVMGGVGEKWEVREEGKTYSFDVGKGVKWEENKELKGRGEVNGDDVVLWLDGEKKGEKG